MLLGKRPRPPMKRTTSMTEFTLDLTIGSDPNPLHPSDQKLQSPPGIPSPRHRRNSADFVETPSFLRCCHLCKRRLIPGRDIFMYRGDSAFCSSECRQQQIYQDEKKEKRLMKKEAAAAMAVAAGSEIVGETVAAAV